MNKTLLSALAVSALMAGVAAPLPAAARGDAQISINIGPPPIRVEAPPPPRRGYVWAPGYWDWRGHRHVWVAGTWVRERQGYYYSQPQWVSTGGHWELQRGGWIRGDRDHDGFRHRRDRDRDGDGVPNRYDARPDNPYRR